jgi:hypothetical protein
VKRPVTILVQAIIQYHNREELREKKAEIKVKRKEIVAGKFAMIKQAGKHAVAQSASQKEVEEARQQQRQAGAPVIAEARRQMSASRDVSSAKCQPSKAAKADGSQPATPPFGAPSGLDRESVEELHRVPTNPWHPARGREVRARSSPPSRRPA